MWFNDKKTTETAISSYRALLLNSHPRHLVIDGLFDQTQLDAVMSVLQQPQHWKIQQHTYSELYVDSAQWQESADDQRFVQRASWQGGAENGDGKDIAQQFLLFLRSLEFMSLLSRIFSVSITDLNVAAPDINTNYFRLSSDDFVKQHADDSPGREVCMLLYLNKNWQENNGGELVFSGKDNIPIRVEPRYNRCVLFDPSSEGSEHWVEKLNTECLSTYRYNVTSWYWSE